MLDLIDRLRDQGRGVLVISHDMKDVQQVADRVVVLRLGAKVAEFGRDGYTAVRPGRAPSPGRTRPTGDDAVTARSRDATSTQPPAPPRPSAAAARGSSQALAGPYRSIPVLITLALIWTVFYSQNSALPQLRTTSRTSPCRS